MHVNAEKQIPEIHLPDSLHTLLPRGAASAPHFLNPGHMLRVLLGLALTLPVALGLAGCGGAASSTPTPTPTPTPTTPDARADAMIAQMTQAQELQLVQGGVTTNATSGYTVPRGAAGYVPGIPALGIPELYLADGSVGVGNGIGPATALPSSIASAAGWDVTEALQVRNHHRHGAGRLRHQCEPWRQHQSHWPRTARWAHV